MDASTLHPPSPLERVVYPTLIPPALFYAREILRLAEEERSALIRDGERERQALLDTCIDSAREECRLWQRRFVQSTVRVLEEIIPLICQEVVGDELRENPTALRKRLERALLHLPADARYTVMLTAEDRAFLPEELASQLTVVESATPSPPQIIGEGFTASLDPDHHLELLLETVKHSLLKVTP